MRNFYGGCVGCTDRVLLFPMIYWSIDWFIFFLGFHAFLTCARTQTLPAVQTPPRTSRPAVRFLGAEVDPCCSRVRVRRLKCQFRWRGQRASCDPLMPLCCGHSGYQPASGPPDNIRRVFSRHSIVQYLELGTTVVKDWTKIRCFRFCPYYTWSNQYWSCGVGGHRFPC